MPKPKARVVSGGKVVTNKELEIEQAKVVERKTAETKDFELEVKEAKRTKRDTAAPDLELKEAVKHEAPMVKAEVADFELGPVVEVKEAEVPEELAVVKAAEQPKVEEKDRMSELPKLLSTMNNANFHSLGELYETVFDPCGDPENGWYNRIVRSIGYMETMSPKFADVLDIVLYDVEKRVKAGKAYNATVFFHIEYPINSASNVEIDHSAEVPYESGIWEYQGDDYIVYEAWLPRGQQYSYDNCRQVVIGRFTKRDDAIRAFMNQRQTMVNKYESGKYEIGELCITVPHLNKLPSLSKQTKQRKCRVKECEDLAEPGRAWCKHHIEEKDKEAKAR